MAKFIIRNVVTNMGNKPVNNWHDQLVGQFESGTVCQSVVPALYIRDVVDHRPSHNQGISYYNDYIYQYSTLIINDSDQNNSLDNIDRLVNLVAKEGAASGYAMDINFLNGTVGDQDVIQTNFYEKAGYPDCPPCIPLKTPETYTTGISALIINTGSSISDFLQSIIPIGTNYGSSLTYLEAANQNNAFTYANPNENPL